MALTNALAEAIKKGYYINSIKDKITYKSVFLELFNYAKTYSYNSLILEIRMRLNYINRRCNELQTQIELFTEEMNDASFSDKYALFLSFLQENADTDSVNIPIFVSTNVALSSRISSLKNIYHELSVLLYKKELFDRIMTNLTKNKGNIDTIIYEITNIN